MLHHIFWHIYTLFGINPILLLKWYVINTKRHCTPINMEEVLDISLENNHKWFHVSQWWRINTIKGIRIQYIPRNMHTVLALLCFVVVIHWLIFPYPSGLLHWHCDNLTIAPVPAKQPWWIWINTSCEFIINDCITTTKQSTTKPCAYFLGYTVRCFFWTSYPCHRVHFFAMKLFSHVLSIPMAYTFYMQQVARVCDDSMNSTLLVNIYNMENYCVIRWTE